MVRQFWAVEPTLEIIKTHGSHITTSAVLEVFTISRTFQFSHARLLESHKEELGHL